MLHSKVPVAVLAALLLSLSAGCGEDSANEPAGGWSAAHSIRMLGAADVSARRTACARLSELARPAPDVLAAVVPLIERMKDEEEDWLVRWHAVRALAAIRPDVHMPRLEEQLPSMTAERRVEVARHLGGLLDGPSWLERRWAAIYLGYLGADAAVAVPHLISALADDDPGVRLHAARALGAVGPAGAEAVPALEAARSDAKGTIRKEAMAALKAIRAR